MINGVTIFDFEVTKHDWIMVAKDVDSGTYYCFHNDPDGLQAFMQTDPWLCGFNVKHYDNHILRGILAGLPPEMIKAVNDRIIVQGMMGWDVPELQDARAYFDTIDLADDVQLGTSLKSFEAHMGMKIKETDVDFDIDRSLMTKEVRLMFDYCRADVNATEVLFNVRMPYLENKLNLGRQCGLSPREALRLTNAKLTAKYLKAKRPDKPRTDERDYKFPENLLTQYIPPEVMKFFEDIHDKSIPDDEYFSRKIDFKLGDCEVTVGFGGIHGAIPVYREKATEERTIRNKDVASYYPNLVRKMGYASRSIPDPKIYADTIDARVLAKRSMDVTTANALKLVLNTTYGAMGNRYNDLFDPLMMRSVCISGQLFLLELSCHLLAECPTLKIIQLNTDGIMVSFDSSDENMWQTITAEWQERTGFELEEDFIKEIIQRDVNNYCEIPVKGSPKLKGGELVRGVLTNGKVDFTKMGFPGWENINGGAFKINNTAVIIPKAIVDYFVKGIPVEETINKCSEILDFQIIPKAGGMYSRCYQLVSGEEVPTQKVNRLYATKDKRYGPVYKVHGETGRHALVAGLPEHCMIDNDNHKGIWCVDKEWYIAKAKQKINEFLGIKPPKVNKRRVTSLTKKCMKLLSSL